MTNYETPGLQFTIQR